MLSSVNADELAEWEAFDRLDPIGQWRQEWNLSRIVHMLHVANVGRRSRLPFSAFIPQWDRHVEPQSIDEQIEMAKRWAAIGAHTTKTG